MKLPVGIVLPLVVERRDQIAQAAARAWPQELLNVPPNSLPVIRRHVDVDAQLREPGRWPGGRRLLHAGHCREVSLVVGDVDRDVEDRLFAAAQVLGPAERDVEPLFAFDHLRAGLAADGRLHDVFHVGHADAPVVALLADRPESPGSAAP